MSDIAEGPFFEENPCVENVLTEAEFSASVLTGDASFLYSLYLMRREDACGDGRRPGLEGFTDAELLAFVFNGHSVPPSHNDVPAVPLPPSGLVLGLALCALVVWRKCYGRLHN